MLECAAMPLLHGADISAAEIEDEVGRWTAERFARLCNAVAWAHAWPGSEQQATPSFTERVNVADNGIDAEWQRDFSAGELSAAAILSLRIGTNVFQYKKRGAGPANRNSFVSVLLSDLRGAALVVESRTGKRLASYILWTNIDLTLEQKGALRAAMLKGIGSRDTAELYTDVVGAAELAAFLNDLPHLRSAFFATIAYQDWGRALEAHRRQSIPIDPTSALPPLIGREGTLSQLRDLVDLASVRAIVVTGPHMIGKTRLVLEATRHRDVDTIEALDPTGVAGDELRRLHKAGREVIVLLQDLMGDATERIIRSALAVGETIKVIITLPTREGSPLPNFGIDDRARLLPLKSLDKAEARGLFAHLLGDVRVDYGIESWIIEQAGGVPGVLLAAARLGRTLRPSAGRFTDQVGSAFAARVWSLIPEESIRKAAAIASLMTQVRAEMDDDAELAALCCPFGITPSAFRLAIERLEAAGYITRRGSFVEVVPPLLANYLAARLIRDGAAEAIRAFGFLAMNGRRRLLRRVAQLPEESSKQFWSRLLDPGGLLGSFAAVLENLELLRAAAPAGIRRVAEVVLEGLQVLALEDRRTIGGEARRGLAWSLGEMMTAPDAAEPAFRALGLLAEAENEQFSNNATGVFCQAAFPLNQQIPLALSRRLTFLQELMAPTRDTAGAILALQAAADALGSGRSLLLIPSRGAFPTGGFPSGLTLEDVRDYRGCLLDAVSAAAEDTRSAVRQKAKAIWPSVSENLIYDGGDNTRRGLTALQRIVDCVLAGDREFTVCRVIDTIALCRANLAGGPTDSKPAEAKQIVASLSELTARLQTGSYEVRLRWRLGNSWRDFDDESGAELSGLRDPFEAKTRAISALAKEACDAPVSLSSDLVEWCLSDEAEASRLYWRELGRHDVEGRWTETALGLAKRENAWLPAVDYLAGLIGRDAECAHRYFERMIADPTMRPEAISYASAVAEGADPAAARMAELVRQNSVTPHFAARFAEHPPHQDRISPSALAALLQAIVGEGFERPELAMHTLAFWFHLHPPANSTDPVSALAWKCLETGISTTKTHDGYEANEIAAGTRQTRSGTGVSARRKCSRAAD